VGGFGCGTGFRHPTSVPCERGSVHTLRAGFVTVFYPVAQAGRP
jgi:hypothetical protein